MRKILIITSSFPSLKNSDGFSGGGEFIHTEVKALIESGYNATVLMPLKKGVPSIENQGKLKIIRFSYPFMKIGNSFNQLSLHGSKSLSNFLSVFFLFIYFIISIYKYVRIEKPNIIWANWLQLGVLAKISTVFENVPVVSTIRGNDIRKMPSFLVRIFSKICRTIINPYQTDPEVRGWIDKYRFKEIKIVNIYKHQEIFHAFPETPVLSIIGRLNNEKAAYHLKGIGIQLFKIINEILEENEDINVYVIGTGTHVNIYKKMLSKYKNRVKFTGWLKDFSKYIEKSTAVIGAGGLNGVAMDTVPNYIPVLISKNITGNFWKDKVNCLVYDPHKIDKFKKTILYALKNKDKLSKYAKRAKKDIDNYSQPISKAALIWESKFNQLIDEYYDK